MVGPGFGGRRGGPGGAPRGHGAQLDPLIAANDAGKPLCSKLLAVPRLRARYLGYVRDIAERWLDWAALGPLTLQWQALIAEDVERDTRKLDTFAAFESGVTNSATTPAFRGPRQPVSLKAFAEQRRAYLLEHAEVKSPASAQVAKAAGGEKQAR